MFVCGLDVLEAAKCQKLAITKDTLNERVALFGTRAFCFAFLKPLFCFVTAVAIQLISVRVLHSRFCGSFVFHPILTVVLILSFNKIYSQLYKSFLRGTFVPVYYYQVGSLS